RHRAGEVRDPILVPRDRLQHRAIDQLHRRALTARGENQREELSFARQAPLDYRVMRLAAALVLFAPLTALAVEGVEDRLRKPGVDIVVAKVLWSEAGRPARVRMVVEEVLKGPIQPRVELDVIWTNCPGKTDDRPAAGERILVMGKSDGKKWNVDPICRWPFSLAKRAWILLVAQGT